MNLETQRAPSFFFFYDVIRKHFIFSYWQYAHIVCVILIHEKSTRTRKYRKNGGIKNQHLRIFMGV